ncbi:hypothetical protein BJ944DRAFT_238618 [Cunninghamella echinulata]|nr:hypothetical protein BJ944DRAFT_238618 [Cunninghamella echinulata]
MSKLPSVNTGIPPPTKRLQRQPSLDLRRKKQPHDPAPMPPALKTSKSSKISRNSVSSYDEMDSPTTSSSRYSTSSFSSIQTAMTSPRSSVTSPKPSGPRKRLSVKPPPIPIQHLPPQQQQQQQVASPISSEFNLRIGERVIVDSMGIVGTLRFLGSIHKKNGTWAGIELDIPGTGKNDGSVDGLQYFSCPPKTGIFCSANKVDSIDQDEISIRSRSPPSPYSSTPQPMNGRTITKGSRAERYIGMSASQLTKGSRQQQHQKRMDRTSSQSSNSRLSTSSNGSVSKRSQSSMASPIHPNNSHPRRTMSRNSYSSSTTRANRSLSVNQLDNRGQLTSSRSSSSEKYDDDYAHDDSLVISDEHMLTETPVPINLAMSESTDLPSSIHTSSSSSSTVPPLPHHHHHHGINNEMTASATAEDSQARLERVLGEAISKAPDETIMRLQQLQLRVEVLEAENKYLKLENTQNKTAEQILERSMILKKMKKNNPNNGENGDEEEDESYFTLAGHKAIVEEIKQEHATKQKVWETDMEKNQSAIKKLENRVFELETEQAELIRERDELMAHLSDARKTSAQMEQKVQELEQKVAIAEANAATALASKTVQTTANFYSQDPEEMQEKQRQMEMEMEEVHDKMTSLMDAMRAKDMFLGTLSEQVEQHRNLVEEKERELRRLKMDGERHGREKDRLLEEIKELETKLMSYEGCVTKEEFDTIKRDYSVTKEHLAKETATVEEYRKRVQTLEMTVDELKTAGMDSLELYENSVELHRVAMEEMNANLQDEQRKIKELEMEKANLVKSNQDASHAFEDKLNQLKQQHQDQLKKVDDERKNWEETVASLKKEIQELVVNDQNQTEDVDKVNQLWENERQRLQQEIEHHIKQFKTEQDAHQSVQLEMEALQQQLQHMEKLTIEKQQLDDQVKRLQTDYDGQLKTRNKYLDEVRSAVESQKKTESDMRRVLESKEKTDRELQSVRSALAQAESTLAALRSSSEDMNGWVNEKQQQMKQIETLRGEIERLEAQNILLTKQKESAELNAKSMASSSSKDNNKTKDDNNTLQRLRADHKQLLKEHDALKEAHKQMENECFKLMDEVEKLHAEGTTTTTTATDDNKDDESTATPDEKIQRLQQQLAETKRQMDKVLLKHSSEIRQLKEEKQESERKLQREISTLNRDVNELEGIIETKIFKEADLEEALENERKTANRLREDLLELRDQQKKNNNNNNGTLDHLINGNNDVQQEIKNDKNSNNSNSDIKDGPYCEICEKHGHDLLSCKIVLDGSIKNNNNDKQLDQLYCENCDDYGLHQTSDCPNQNETF